tara:strand:+ start:993 stop:1313 length:321 start_codon:yes stop_codon:yes gene_type:complete
VYVESGEIDELFLSLFCFDENKQTTPNFLVCSTTFPPIKHCRQINTTSRHHGEYKFPIFFYFFFFLFLAPLFAVSIDHRVLSQRASFFLIISRRQKKPGTDQICSS